MPAKGPGEIICRFECQNMTRGSVWFAGQSLMFARINLTHCRMLANVAILGFFSNIMTFLVLSFYIEACRFTNITHMAKASYQYYSTIEKIYFQGVCIISYSRLSVWSDWSHFPWDGPPPIVWKKISTQQSCHRPGPQNPMANKATVARAVLKEAEVVLRHHNLVNKSVIWFIFRSRIKINYMFL